MKITFHRVHKIIPVPVLWTNSFLHDWMGGRSFGYFCIIRPKYLENGDTGILAHELKHSAQFWSMFPIYGLRYLFSDSFRLRAEAEAYASQLACYPYRKNRVARFVDSIATKYDIDASHDEIEAVLRKECAKLGLDLTV